MKRLVEQAAENDNITTLYVKKRRRNILWCHRFNRLNCCQRVCRVRVFGNYIVSYVHDHETVDDCIEELKDYSEDSIPV